MAITTVDQHVFRRLGIEPGNSRSELEARQLEVLRRTINRAKASCSFYRKQFSGINPAGLREIKDLEQLPFMDGDDVRNSGHEMLCVSQSQVARVVTMHTSGSTGEPKRYFFTQRDLRSTRSFFYDGMLSLISPRDHVLVLLPWEQPASVGGLLIDALSSKGIMVEGCWPPDFANGFVPLIRSNRISCVVGLPPHLLHLSEMLSKGDLKSMLLCSDYASPVLRRRIEQNVDCSTFLHYGSTESGLGGGVECSNHDGCHVRESDLLFEIVDLETGRQLPDGSAGEIVLTTLAREAMPLIRYRTGDHGVKLSTPCRCGGISVRLCSLTGRITPCRLRYGGEIYSDELDDLLYAQPGLLDYRVMIHDKDDIETMDISFTVTAGTVITIDDIRSQLVHHPVIARNVAVGNMQIGEIRPVDEFSADHTWKRTILDKRNIKQKQKGRQCASFSIN